jgi:preprotein translocase subunit SecG
MTKNIFKLTTLFIATAIISFSSCTKKNDDPTFYSSLSVTHASPDAPAVDILIDNSKVTTAPFSYTNTTGYLKNLISGKRNIKVNVAGTTTNVINADITFEGNKSYSLFAIDSVSKLLNKITFIIFSSILVISNL